MIRGMKLATLILFAVALIAGNDDHGRHGRPPADVPEPATMVLVAASLVGLAIAARRKKGKL